MNRLVLTAVYCVAAVFAALAQSETPPDLKAYREAIKETDAEKKIAALEKWKTEFPDSNMRDSADTQILTTLVTRLPAQQDRIRRFAAGLYKRAAAKDKGYTAYTIATEFLNANILLKDARGYARKGVEAMALSKYIQDQLAGYEARKQKAPSPEELKKRFDNSRSFRLAALGRIELRLGNTDKGKKLLEDSNASDGTNGVVLSELGVLAAKAGDPKAADYLVSARLSGRATKEGREAFEDVYRKQHNGSLDGMDAMLDAEYTKRYPNPVKVERYQPTEKRSDRVVLAEVFTGSGCGPCAGADLAFDAALERYARKDLALIMYHVHVPRPDPMTTTQTIALQKAYEVPGVPTFLIDGKKTTGGGPRDAAKSIYDRFGEDIRSGLETPAEAHITAGVSVKGNIVNVNARVKGVKSESKDLKVQIALVEKDLRYNGENGIRFHPMVLRSIQSFELGGETYQHSFDVAAISKSIKDHLDDYESKGHRGETFTFSEKKYAINPGHLAVVVFVHDAKTRHVLQAGYIDLAADAANPTFEASQR